MVNVNDTLAERGSRYGDFRAHAEITQGLKGVMQQTPGWQRLTASMKESLEMIAHKVGRILNGDPTYADSWHDISGYATLVDAELTADQAASESDKATIEAAVTKRPVPPEFAEPAAPKTKAEFAKAVTPKTEVKTDDAPETAEAVPAPASPAEADAVAPKLPENVSKYVAPKAPVAPAAPVAPVVPETKD